MIQLYGYVEESEKRVQSAVVVKAFFCAQLDKASLKLDFLALLLLGILPALFLLLLAPPIHCAAGHIEQPDG